MVNPVAFMAAINQRRAIDTKYALFTLKLLEVLARVTTANNHFAQMVYLKEMKNKI